MRHETLCKALSMAAAELADTPGLAGLLYDSLQTIIALGVELDHARAEARLWEQEARRG